MPPGELPIMLHRCGDRNGSLAFGPAFEEALGRTPAKPIVVVRVKRRKTHGGAQPWAVSLPTYVDFRCKQGVSVTEAVDEWNGGHLVGGIVDAGE